MTPASDQPDRSTPPTDAGGLLARIIGDGESPGWWGIPIGRIAGCELRVHLVTPVFVLAVLGYAVWNGLGVPFVATGLAALVVVVLLHEAARGHALERWCGLRPAGVTVWPLGGVWRFADEGASATAEAKGGVAGLAMLVGIALVAGAAVVLWTHDAGKLLFNPVRPGLVIAEFEAASTAAALGRIAVWQVYAAALYVLAAHLLPMLPLDGGLVLRSVAHGGAERGLAARVGLVTAVVLVAGGLLTGLVLVAALGLCGGAVCWSEWQSGRFVLDPAGVDRWRAACGAGSPGDETTGAGPPIPPEERERVERILAKISSRGMASLTRAERRQLQRATEKLRDP